RGCSVPLLGWLGFDDRGELAPTERWWLGLESIEAVPGRMRLAARPSAKFEQPRRRIPGNEVRGSIRNCRERNQFARAARSARSERGAVSALTVSNPRRETSNV